MAITKENIQQLIALQEQDAALDKVQKEMDLIPRQIAVFKADLDAAKAKVAEFKAKTLALEKLKKEKELELAAREEAVRKHSMELNQVKTNDAFKALQQEIEAGERLVVGVNTLQGGPEPEPELTRIPPEVEQRQLEGLKKFKAQRDRAAVRQPAGHPVHTRPSGEESRPGAWRPPAPYIRS